MEEIILKLIFGQPVTESDITDALYDVCDDNHSSCNDGCPVYRLNGGTPPGKNPGNCDCFKNGHAMKQFIIDNK